MTLSLEDYGWSDFFAAEFAPFAAEGFEAGRVFLQHSRVLMLYTAAGETEAETTGRLRYLARGGATRVLEGSWSPKRCVVLEFPTMQQFETWWNSPEYQPLRALRERTTRSHLIVTEGV